MSRFTLEDRRRQAAARLDEIVPQIDAHPRPLLLRERNRLAERINSIDAKLGMST